MRISDWSSDVCSSDLDGSEVEACGNATRCVAALVGRECSIETAGGLLSAAPGGDGASVDMGAPRFGWEEIPLAYALDTTALPVGWEMLEGAAAIHVGNPHLVFFVPDLDDVPLARRSEARRVGKEGGSKCRSR